MEEITGFVERITFQNVENGFTVAKVKNSSKGELISIVGTMPSLAAGEYVRCKGKSHFDPQHGPQFQVEEFTVSYPKAPHAIEKYLSSGIFKGIGPSFAKKIVSGFQEKTIEILNETPEKLLEIPGIGKKRVEGFIKCWQEQSAVRDIMIFLKGAGVGISLAQKIYKSYGAQSIALLEENPYRLSRELFGVGFKTSDSLAKNLGLKENSDARIDAALEHLLLELSQEGHTCIPQETLIEKASEMLSLDTAYFAPRLIHLESEERIVRMSKVETASPQLFVWIASLFRAEKSIGMQLNRLLSGKSHLREVQVEKALEWVQEKNKIELAEKQKQAIAYALQEKLLICTGGPGTGKSTLISSLMQIVTHITDKVFLAAPTGRAAKRLAEVTQHKASTLHALLEVDFRKGGFKRNLENPLECDYLIIDEFSMVDTYLMAQLLKAIPDHARLMLVGDINQLPSVGAGAVLKDMIQTKLFPTVELKEIFRQAQGSEIILNAHRINQGKFPHLYSKKDADFFFIEEDDPEKILTQVRSLVSSRLPNKYGFHPIEEIQVLTPMKKGIVGSQNLNRTLQETLNSSPISLQRGHTKYSPGDKVMQIRNNYDKGVFNGDVGIIQEISFEEETALVRFMEQTVSYEFSELNELTLAYAVSIHKFQGSECPCVIVPIHTSHFKLLNRNLLYTAVTRGKKLVILLGTKRALAICIRNAEAKTRFTGLQEALLKELSPTPF